MRFGWRCRGELWEGRRLGVCPGRGRRRRVCCGGTGCAGWAVQVGAVSAALRCALGGLGTGVAGGRGGSGARAGRAEWGAAARNGRVRA